MGESLGYPCSAFRVRAVTRPTYTICPRQRELHFTVQKLIHSSL